MRIKLICCDVFLRMVSAFVAVSPHTVDVEYLPMLAHNKPDELRAKLQARINAAFEQRSYDMLLLAYGLCGNATLGLTCPVRMVIPRVHDCCTMFMGSKERFVEEFKDNLSMRWCTCGYYERCIAEEGRDGYFSPNKNAHPEYLAYAAKYGEETADYLWESMHPLIETAETAYIRIEGFERAGVEQAYTALVEEQGKKVRVLEGSAEYLRDLINGPWDDARFLVVEPGQKIGAVYDMERVLEAVD